MKTTGVGVVGASIINPGWANIAHLPAIASLPEFTLRAVAASNEASAEAARAALGVNAYHDVAAMAADPDVDLVVVAVKVPHHRAASLAAIEAGKMVFTEWPLGRSLEEAEEMASRAETAGLRSIIGLQARYAPAVQRARELVADGYVGRVLSTNMVASGMIWGDRFARAQTYLLDRDSGAGVISVPLMHALEALCFVLGEFETVDAAGSVRRSSVTIDDDGSSYPVTAPDHISLSGVLAGGLIASVSVRGARSRGDNLRWEIHGSDGDLVLTSDNGNLQTAIISLAGARGDSESLSPIPLADADSPADPLAALGATMRRQYAALAQDLLQGVRTVPDFRHAVHRHRLLAAIEAAMDTGVRQRVPLPDAVHRDLLLDEALDESFPASDPVSSELSD